MLRSMIDSLSFNSLQFDLTATRISAQESRVAVEWHWQWFREN